MDKSFETGALSAPQTALQSEPATLEASSEGFTIEAGFSDREMISSVPQNHSLVADEILSVAQKDGIEAGFQRLASGEFGQKHTAQGDANAAFDVGKAMTQESAHQVEKAVYEEMNVLQPKPFFKSAEAKKTGSARSVVQKDVLEATYTGKNADTKTAQVKDQGNSLPNEEQKTLPENLAGSDKDNIDPKTQEAKKPFPVSENVSADPEYKKIWAEEYNKARQKGDINTEDINHRAAKEYYGKWAKKVIREGLPDEIKNDPLFKQKLGEVLSERLENEKPINNNLVVQEALAKYKQEKDTAAEKLSEPKKEKEELIDKRLKGLDEKVSSLNKNGQQTEEELRRTKEELEKTQKMLLELALITANMVQNKADKEEDEQKKQGWIAILFKLTAMIISASFGVEKETKESARKTEQRLEIAS